MSQIYRAICPQCSASYELPEDYVTNYGGQITQCHNCGGPVTIPTLTAAPPPLPPAGVTVLPYAGPAVVQEGTLWRDGKILVTTRQAVLPARCVKCNVPVAEPPMKRTLRWHHPALIVLVLVNILPYAIIAICIQKSGKIQVSLCPEHRRRRRYHMLGAWLCAAAGVAGIVLAVSQENGYFAVAGALLLIGAGVWGIIGPAILTPKRIDNNFMWLRGACVPFLDTLPELPKVPLVAATPTYPIA